MSRDSNVSRSDTGEWLTNYGKSITKINTRAEGGPPASIPTELLPKLAREAAEWDLSMALEKKRPLQGRIAAAVMCVLISLGFTFAAFYIPDMSLHWNNLGKVDTWIRDYVQNDDFQWSSVFLWYSLLILGYAYVAFWTCGRFSPFSNRKQRHRDIFYLLIVGFFLFFLAPIFTISGRVNPDTATTSFTDSIFHNIHEDSIAFSVIYNFFCYIIPFWIGIHYTYLDKLSPINKLGVKFHEGRWRQYTRNEALVIFTLILFALIYFGVHIWLLFVEGFVVVMFYCVIYVCFACVLYLISLYGIIFEKYVFYPNHYFVALVLIPFTRFENPFSAIGQGLLVGVFVEGVARWNFGSLWQGRKHMHARRVYMQWLKDEEDSEGLLEAYSVDVNPNDDDTFEMP
eukprot:TRINITY_DN9163_c0_g1_i1.p1 TRINITY_DN9163_c0_g1~~TRINITY_DN9163_c0_g1_i1.p1  ORF type:complete len:399 (+),score=40.26 TRINITY_DN9163_c0_g1_i1:76-1272(+)